MFNHANNNVAIIREQHITRLMPDLCYILPSVGANETMNPLGYVEADTPTYKTWRGIIAIPCRYDGSRAFRPDEVDVQVAVVTEYNLHLPHDLDINEDDNVIFIAGGDIEIFEIRKLKRLSDWSYTVEALILQVDTDLDLPSIPPVI